MCGLAGVVDVLVVVKFAAEVSAAKSCGRAWTKCELNGIYGLLLNALPSI